MSLVVSFVDYVPVPRYDGLPWLHVRIFEAPTSAGPWSYIDVKDLLPVDTDPANPMSRSFTTSAATVTGQWYHVVYIDNDGNESDPTSPVLNADDLSLYIEREDIKESGSITGAFTDPDIDRAIDAACRGLDQACGRKNGFYPSPVKVMYYTPTAADAIPIDDLVSLTEMASADLGEQNYNRIWTQDIEVSLTPLNAPLFPIPEPFTRIIINPWQASVGFPYWAPRSVRITGVFGWPAVPAGIVEAADLLTKRLLQRAKAAPLGVQFNADMAMRIAWSDPDVKNMMQPFIREVV